MNPVEYTGQENRITFQLYEYWYGLAGDRDIPPLKALAPEDIAPYKNNMVLIDLRDPDNEPTLQIIGQLLLQDVGQDLNLAGISQIPRRTILSRITDHHMEVLANKTPISFEAEFENNPKEKMLYRAILLPFSDDGQNINFILGAVRWINENDLQEPRPEPRSEQETAAESENEPETEDSQSHLEIRSQLQTQLDDCRKLVQGQNTTTDLRSRKSLYHTLGAVLDFHELGTANPDQYDELLCDAGIKAQKRAPFTPSLKLCFGQDYDKTRLTEYAAALSFAQKNHKSGAEMPAFLNQFPGGIKGCVQAVREGRLMITDEPIQNTPEENRKVIRELPSLTRFSITTLPKEAIETDKEGPLDKDGLCLMLGLRDGAQIDVIKILKNEEKILSQILRRRMKDL